MTERRTKRSAAVDEPVVAEAPTMDEAATAEAQPRPPPSP